MMSEQVKDDLLEKYPTMWPAHLESPLRSIPSAVFVPHCGWSINASGKLSNIPSGHNG